ncbi:MAG: glycosyltransferase family 2 protein [Candidatus Odinarchaeia archaeon]
MVKRKNKLSLIIPTMNRYEILSKTLPILAERGFDEIIVVDSSGRKDAEKNKKLCQKLNVCYHWFTGNREEARNFGVKKAKGNWIYIFDDDLVLLKFNWELFEEIASKKYDFIQPKTNRCVWIFRKDFFIKIGGYDPNLCYEDDYDITFRAYKNGRGIRVDGLTESGKPIRGNLKTRWRGALIYSMSMGSFFVKYPTLRRALSIPYRPIVFLREFFKQRTKENFTKFMLTMFGVLLSPIYYLKYPPRKENI